MARGGQNDDFEVEVSWALIPESPHWERIRYQLQPKDGFRGGWRVKGTHEIAEELEKIRKAMGK
jgi:hypothetical protein